MNSEFRISDSELTIGLTSTVPIEPIYAAGLVPKDLNNLFVTSPKKDIFLRRAEKDGLGKNVCVWVRGVYGAAVEMIFRKVCVVVSGDCAHFQTLQWMLEDKGIKVIPFHYPLEYSDEFSIKDEIVRFAQALGISNLDTITEVKHEIDKIRDKLVELDQMTWKEGVITSEENHLWLLKSSDFSSDYKDYSKQLNDFIAEAKSRDGKSVVQSSIRLGYIGVPPVWSDFYEQINRLGGNIVFNEVQRQFSMPCYKERLYTQYAKYTYPYGIKARVEDIKIECGRRGIQGVIHYIQCFCHRYVEDAYLRMHLNFPILTIEGEQPGNLDPRTKLRLEAFINMLKSSKF